MLNVVFIAQMLSENNKPITVENVSMTLSLITKDFDNDAVEELVNKINETGLEELMEQGLGQMNIGGGSGKATNDDSGEDGSEEESSEEESEEESIELF